jgi:hypothetical protein
MWSHYAGGHTGICLEFDTLAVPFANATQVEYRSTYPAYDLVDVGYEPLVTKSQDWSYEAEWRLIAEERGFAQSNQTVKTNQDFLKLPSSTLKSVTIGCLAGDKVRQKIRTLVKTHDPRVTVRQAEIAPDLYEVEITPSFA